MDDEELRNLVHRRRVLQGLGAAGIAGLAGCVGGDGDGDGDGDGTGDGSGDGDGDGTGDGTGDGDGDGDGQAQRGGKLRFAQVKSPIEFDPIVLNDVPSSEVAAMMFEGLYTYDEGTEIIPELAAGEPEIEQDGTRYIVELQDGPTFHNGDPVTGEDVKYSYEALVDEETENANEVVMIDTIEVVDEQTVQFDLQYPFAPFMTTLTRAIVPMSVREEDRDAFNTQNPVGTGAYEFDDWTEGEFARVVRHDDYWGDTEPYLDEIEFVPVEEPTTRITTLQNQENDIIKEIPPELWDVTDNFDHAHVDESTGINYFYLAFNCNSGPTTDPLVREAVDYVFDMDQAVANFVEPTGVRQVSPVPRAIAEDWDFPLDEWADIPHGKDIGQAQQLFDEAGVSRDYNWNIIVPPDDKRENIGITVGNGLQEAGFDNVEVQRLDWGAFLDRYVSGDENQYNMYTLGWSGTPDPDSFTYYLFGRTDDTLGVTNGTFWGNNSDVGQETSDMFQQARETPDEDERRQLYIDGITNALEERAHIASYNLNESFGVQNHVNDFTSHSVLGWSLFSQFNNTWKEQ